MPTIDEAIERAARAADPNAWLLIDQWEPYRGTPQHDTRADDLRNESLKRTIAAITAFLAVVPVSEGMIRAGSFAKWTGPDEPDFADMFKAMSAKLAEELQ